jgi:ABC-type nitrate/sulfonate/bicarbonate transport system permease component
MLKKLFIPYSGSLSREIRVLAAIQAVFLIGLWFAAPNTYIPSPVEIARAWNDLAGSQGMLVELYNSAIVVWQALFISMMISITMSSLNTAAFFKPLVQWATALRFLGFAGITFMFTLMLGGGAALKLWLLTFGMTVFFLTNQKAEIESISGSDVDYVKTLRLKGWRITWELGVRGSLDRTLDIARQNAAIGWTLLSMVEGLVRSEGGIGTLLLNQNKHFHLSAVFAIQLTILLYGILQDWILGVIRKVICPYTVLTAPK